MIKTEIDFTNISTDDIIWMNSNSYYRNYKAFIIINDKNQKIFFDFPINNKIIYCIDIISGSKEDRHKLFKLMQKINQQTTKNLFKDMKEVYFKQVMFEAYKLLDIMCFNFYAGSYMMYNDIINASCKICQDTEEEIKRREEKERKEKEEREKRRIEREKRKQENIYGDWIKDKDLYKKFGGYILKVLYREFRIFDDKSGFSIPVSITQMNFKEQKKYLVENKKEIIMYMIEELKKDKYVRKIGDIRLYELSDIILKRDSTIVFYFKVKQNIESLLKE